MKTKSLFTLCFIILHSSFILSTHAQGTAFTYQDRLNNNGAVANGAVGASQLASNSITASQLARPTVSVGEPDGLCARRSWPAMVWTHHQENAVRRPASSGAWISIAERKSSV
jgi:hypothetical protein